MTWLEEEFARAEQRRSKIPEEARTTVIKPWPTCYCPAGRLSGHPRHTACWPEKKKSTKP